MAIVVNGDVEKLKSVDCSTGKDTEKSDQLDLSILNSIYKIRKGHKFSVAEEGARKKARPNGNPKMTNGPTQSSSPPAHQTASNQTSATKVNGSPDSANSSAADEIPTDSSAIKSPSLSSKLNRSQESNVPINSSLNSAKSNAPSIETRTPPASSAPIDSANRSMNCKETNQPNLSAIPNGLTASPLLSAANKFSIANILNDDAEAPLDSYRRSGQPSIDLPANASSLLVPNMMLNQNDLTALSSFNLIAWQASYAAQHAQAGNCFILQVYDLIKLDI